MYIWFNVGRRSATKKEDRLITKTKKQHLWNWPVFCRVFCHTKMESSPFCWYHRYPCLQGYVLTALPIRKYKLRTLNYINCRELVENWSSFDRVLIEFWCGPVLIEFWSTFGRHLVEIWSGFGRETTKTSRNVEVALVRVPQIKT